MHSLCAENSRHIPALETTYFSWCREDILNRVPANCRRVLSVGCGAGKTEGALVARGLHVTGIEKDQHAAAAARKNGVQVIEGDASRPCEELRSEAFDCIIYADILEHLPDPLKVLRSHVSLLQEGGRVIISVPNFRHWSVFWDLFVRGHVRYQDAGIFDRTHLRLTTRRLVEEWFREVGVLTKATEYRMAQRREKLISALSFGLAREFVARQIIVVGEKI